MHDAVRCQWFYFLKIQVFHRIRLDVSSNHVTSKGMKMLQTYSQIWCILKTKEKDSLSKLRKQNRLLKLKICVYLYKDVEKKALGNVPVLSNWYLDHTLYLSAPGLLQGSHIGYSQGHNRQLIQCDEKNHSQLEEKCSNQAKIKPSQPQAAQQRDVKAAVLVFHSLRIHNQNSLKCVEQKQQRNKSLFL